MPRITRSATVAADPDAVWTVVADPHTFPRWWPGVDRVEDVTESAWTQVLTSSRGKAVRADFTRTSADPPRVIEWRQEVAESPFERFISEAATRVTLDAAGPGETRVEIRARRRLRGLALLGGALVRLATRRQLDEALRGLAAVVERRGAVEAP
jgi:carbon monoxide dehydrogenase subunit G